MNGWVSLILVMWFWLCLLRLVFRLVRFLIRIVSVCLGVGRIMLWICCLRILLEKFVKIVFRLVWLRWILKENVFCGVRCKIVVGWFLLLLWCLLVLMIRFFLIRL